MVEFIVANMPPIMFLTLIGFLLLGFPVAFSLAANGIFYAIFKPLKVLLQLPLAAGKT